VIFHENEKYVHVRELGRGTFGIVYLYQQQDNPANKIALKAARAGNRISSSSINNEGNYHKKIANFGGGLNKYVPKFLG
jgi:predicted Ser/Thr protein kinase